MEFNHISVLLNETIEALHINPNGTYIDGTAGGGGHSSEIAKHLKNGRLLAIDRDNDAIKAASERLMPYGVAKVVKGNFSDMKSIAAAEGIEGADGILLDIGVSSHQLDTPERGFSFHNDAYLDMRMGDTGPTAADLVNTLSAEELAKIFFEYGEEKFSRKIAREIVKRRETEKIERTLQLAQIISDSVPAASKRDGHPARRCFQALRIEVNGELDALEKALNDAFDLLNVGGILAVITFHSLEDRMVKRSFAERCKGCDCPKEFPICVCGKTPEGKLVLRNPVTATEEELKLNPRSRSAKLRAIQKMK